MLLFAVGLLLPNCDMPRKELNPPCISEQVGEWKCREQENVYGICRGADRRSARKPKYWGYVLAHHPGIFTPFSLPAQFPYYQIGPPTGHALYCACVKKCLPARLAPMATTGCLKYSKGMRAGGARRCGAAAPALLHAAPKPQRAQARGCWGLGWTRWQMTAKGAWGKVASRQMLP